MRTARVRLLTVATVALIAGLGVGRFLTYDAPDGTAVGVTTASGGPADVVAGLERAVAEDPQDTGAWQTLGLAYTTRAAETGDPAFYGLAERALARAEELHPGAPETLVGKGHLALALHDFEAARTHAEQARERRPHSAEVLGVLVDAAVELGDYDAAAAHLQDMLDLRPGLPALARTSYLRELRGDLPGAVEAMRRAETAGSASPFDLARVRALLGDLHRTAGDLEASAAAYERALEAAPQFAAAAVGLARVEAARGDTAAAITRLQALVDRFPQPEAVILLGDLHARAGDDARAEEQYELARVISRLQADAGQNVDLELAVFEADRGEDPKRALELAQRAYDARPSNVYAADALAWAQLRAGDAEAAVPLVEDALRLGTADPLLRYHAAEVFAAAGDAERARRELAAAVEGRPWVAPGYAERAAELAGELGLPWPPRGGDA